MNNIHLFSIGRSALSIQRNLLYLILITFFLLAKTNAQYLEQGGKLNNGYTIAKLGTSVSISGDGNTAIIGGPTINSYKGQAMIFTRSNGVWTQHSILTGAESTFGDQQGTAVSISGDGNTVIIGAPFHDASISNGGGAWVFSLSGGVWTQQGLLVGSGGKNSSNQGSSVSLSYDGNTAIVGGPNDDISKGAAWVFTRSAGVWTQQGSKFFGSDHAGLGGQGYSVALSGDGNTALVGGGDTSYKGSVNLLGSCWVFTRSDGVWTQQGTKLFASSLGSSVALSSDGNTAVIGHSESGSNKGTTLIYTRNAGVWTQQGSNLLGSGGTDYDKQGSSVSISGDGNTVVTGGPVSGANGLTWIFTRSNGVWTQLGSSLLGTNANPPHLGSSSQGYSVAISSDGSTILSGGPEDYGSGATWVFYNPTRTSSSSGNWNVASTWLQNRVPVAGDVVSITNGNNVVLNVNPSASTITVNSGGTLTVSSTRSLSTSLTINGTMSVGGALTINSTVTNNGTLNLNIGGSILFNTNPVPALAGTFNWNSGSLTVGSSIDFTLTSSLTIPSGGTLQNNGLISLNNGILLQSNGSLSNSGTLNLNSGGTLSFNKLSSSLPAGTFNWNTGGNLKVGSNGNLTVSNSFDVPVSCNLIVDGSFRVYNSSAMTNSGTITVNGFFYVDGNSSFTNSSGGNLNISSGGYLYSGSAYENGTVTNNSGGIVSISGKLDNREKGTVTNNGSLTINNLGYLDNYNIFTNNGSIVNNYSYFAISSSTTSNNGTFTNNSNLLTNAGIFNSNGNLILNTVNAALPGGTFNWNSGTLTIGSNGSYAVSSPLTVVTGRTLAVDGSLTIDTDKTLTVNSGGALTINSGGILINNSTTGLVDNGTITNGGTLTNNGGIELNTGGNFVLNSNPASLPGGTFNWNSGGTLSLGSSGDFTNSTTFTVQTGRIFQIEGTFTNSGTLTLDSGSNLVLNASPAIIPGGTFNWNDGSKLTIGSSGTYTNSTTLTIQSDRTLEVIGTLTNSGTLSIASGGNLLLNNNSASLPAGTFNWNSGGKVTIGSSGSFTQSSEFTIPTGATLQVDGTFANGSTLTNNGGVTLNSGSLTINSNSSSILNSSFVWNGGTLTIGTASNTTLSNQLIVPSGGLFVISGTLINNTTITNNGQFNYYSSGTLTNNNTIINEDGAAFGGQGIFNLESGATYITNSSFDALPGGTFNWKKGSTVKVGSGAFIEMFGPLNIEEDRIFIVDGSIQSYGNTITNNGILKGSGAITADFLTSITGKFAPGNSIGSLSIGGSLNMGSSEYVCEIDGVAGTKDVLAPTGNAVLTNATLKVNWLTNLTVAATYDVMTFASRTGEFASVAIPPVEGFTFTVTYTDTKVIVNAKEAPVAEWTGGTSNDWNDASNWNPAIVPTSNNTIRLPASGVANELVIISPISVAHIEIGANRTLTLSGGNNLSVQGVFKIETGATFNLGSSTVNLNGNWSNSGTFNAGTGKVIMNGVTQQTMLGSTFNDLEINNSAGVVFLDEKTVNGTLTLTSGKITLGTSDLILGATATISGADANKYIVTNSTGKVSREIAASGSFVFPVGSSSDSYNPLSVELQAGDPTETFSVRVEPFTNTSTGFSFVTDTTLITRKLWEISEATTGGNNVKLSFQWNSSESGSNLGINTSNPVSVAIHHYNAGLSSYELVDNANGPAPGSNPIVVTTAGYSVSSFSPFIVGAAGGALPVELTTFYATLNDDSVLLNWETATEVNNYGFEIERQLSVVSGQLSDEASWEIIGFVEGNGNSNSQKEYSFADQSLKNGKYSYRLKQIDFEGKFEYSGVVEVELNILPTEYELSQNYPNPFNPTTTIKYSIPSVETGHAPSLQLHVTLKVYDILGNEVAELVNEKKEAGKYTVKFNASNLASGVYFSRFNSGSYSAIIKMLLIK